MAELSVSDIDRWTAYAAKIECDRCGESLFWQEAAREEVLHVAEHYDLGAGAEAEEWRLYLRDSTGGLCEYCKHMMTKDD